jgi:hypothetical protein
MAKSKVQGENVSALAERFLTQLKHKGFTVNACEHVSGKQQAYVPVQDNALESYLAELTKGREAERAVVYAIDDEDIASLGAQEYALDAIAEEIVEAPPAPLAVVLHVSNRHGEYIHSVSDSGKVTFCWDKKFAGRVALDDVARIEQHLAAHGVEALAEWA